MLESYGVLILAGLCVLLTIWIHAQQTRRSSQPISGVRESGTMSQPLYARRAGDEPDYAELQKMSREGGLQTYRLEDTAPPLDLLVFDRPGQLEMLLQMPGDNLLLVLHAEFPEPCSGEVLFNLLNRAGLLLVEDGLYRKTQEHYGSPVPIYYVANHNSTGSFAKQGRLIEALHQITFFTQLSMSVNGLQVFNGMLRVAEDVCDQLGGVLRNEQYEPLTRELIEGMVQQADAFASSHSNLDQVLTH